MQTRTVVPLNENKGQVAQQNINGSHKDAADPRPNDQTPQSGQRQQHVDHFRHAGLLNHPGQVGERLRRQLFVRHQAGEDTAHVRDAALPILDMKHPEKLLLEADELTYNDYIRLQKIFNPKETGNATAMMRELRRIKTPYEIEMFRISAERHAKTYAEIPECFRPGMTDLEFQYEIEKRMRKNGSIGLFRAFGANMDIFMGSILAGENAEVPSPFDFALGGSGIDASCPLGANGTPLKEGTAIMVDMAGNYTAYMTDMTRVFSVGHLTELAYRAHQTALLIESEIENIARPGTPCAELYEIAAKITESQRLGAYFMGTKQQAKFVGHGIGIQINELPVLTPRSKDMLEPNMVFALEPKYVIPGIGAVGIENSFLVTETGLEKITHFTEDIIQLDK